MNSKEKYVKAFAEALNASTDSSPTFQAFAEALNVGEESVEQLKYQSVEEWDSVGHMSLIAAIEDAFDIMMDTDDIIDLNSYEKGKELLSKKL